MAGLDKEIRKIIMAGLGAIGTTVEKSKDAIEEFVRSDGVKNMAEKGENLFQSAVELGKKAVDKVKDTFTEDEIEQKVREEREKLTRLAREIRGLNKDELKILNKLVAEGDEAVFTSDESVEQPGHEASAHDSEHNRQDTPPER
jgi:polyhydroxyalkanoate synthesis regulator phasin